MMKLEQRADEFWKIVRPEIEAALKEEGIAVNKETVAAAIAGASLGVRVMGELIEQYLKDKGTDPSLFITALKCGFGGGRKKC